MKPVLKNVKNEICSVFLNLCILCGLCSLLPNTVFAVCPSPCSSNSLNTAISMYLAPSEWQCNSVEVLQEGTLSIWLETYTEAASYQLYPLCDLEGFGTQNESESHPIAEYTVYPGQTYAVNVGNPSTSNALYEVEFSFTPSIEPPSQAESPYPWNGQTGININIDVAWSDGGGAEQYRVFFGTDSTPDSGEDRGTQTPDIYDPGTLNYQTTYYWKINSINSAGETEGDVWHFTTEASPNQCPSLSYESYYPEQDGGTATEYVFYVAYDDPDQDSPDLTTVYINNDSYRMNLYTGNPYAGTYISDPMALPGGQTTYYFVFEDANGCQVRYPEQGFFNGPYINSCFSLSSGQVTPTSGSPEETFVYSISYSDPDGDAPSVHTVNIDGQDYPLQLRDGSGTASSGIYEHIHTGLSESSHEFYFYFEDGRGCSFYYPGQSAPEPISGPIVERPNLTLNNVDSSPRSAGPGETIHVTGEVVNSGGVQVGPVEHQIFINWWMNFREFVPSSLPVETFSSPQLLPDESYPFDIEITIPGDLPPGFNYLAVVEIDWNSQLEESNEDPIDNNHFTPIIGYLNKIGIASQSSYSGDPVNTALGNFTYTNSDLTISGRGLDIDFSRYYNSQGSDGDLNVAPVGISWSHSYNIYIKTIPDSEDLLVVYGDGKQHLFRPDGSGGYVPPVGVYDTLIQNPDDTYYLNHKNQLKYHFNSVSNNICWISAIEDRNGNTISFSYTDGRLTTITDTVGREVQLSYNTFYEREFLQSIQGPIRNPVVYDYDALGNLISVTDPRGNATHFTYSITHEYKHLLTSINNNRGIDEITNFYGDKVGQENTDANFYGYLVVRQLDALGNETLYRYETTDMANRYTTIIGPDSGTGMNTTLHYYDQSYRFIREVDPLGNETEFIYNADGNLEAVVDKNSNRTEYTYDDTGNILTKTDPEQCITLIEYNSFNDPVRKVLDYGGMDIEWQYIYTPEGNLETEIDPELNITSYTYNAYGQLQTKVNANQNTTEYFYEDPHFNLTRTRGPGGCEHTFEYDDVGRKTREVDPLMNATDYHYDANDNLEWIDDTLGNRIVHTYDENNNRISTQNRRGYTTTYEYDAKDRLERVVGPAPSSHVTQTEYDAYDRKTKVTDPYGNETDYVYDAMGNLEQIINADDKITRLEYDPNGNKTKMIDPDNNEWEYGYDENNRLVWEEDPHDNRTIYAYYPTGWRRSVTDAKDQQTRFEYYPTGRIKQVTDPDGGQTYCTYDNVGNRLTERDARGNTITYEYDEYNRVEKIIDRNQQETVFEYDCMNMTARIDGNLHRVDYAQYDRYQRLERKEMPGPEVVTFSYDLNGNLREMTDPLGTTTYTYDELDRLTGVEDPFGKTVGYTYDPTVHRTTLTYPDSNTVAYDYDAMGRLASVTDWTGFTTTYTYDDRGNLQRVANTTGTHVDYTYDVAGRLKTAVDQTSGGATISSFQYTMDKLGNRTDARMDVPLAPVLAPIDNAASYDAANQIENWGEDEFGFDDAGRQIEKTGEGETTMYTFNTDDRLTEVVKGPSTFQYQYNGLGDRLSRTENGAETRYVLDLSGDMSRVLCDTDSAGNITAYYVHGAGLLYKVTPGGERTHFHYDPIGSTIALTDESETITDRYAYDAYGQMVSSEGSSDNPFKYVGQYGVMDEGNGLLFMRARFYDPVTKRFLSRDPVEGDVRNTQGLNPFIYAGNRPTLSIDPNGEVVVESAVSLAALYHVYVVVDASVDWGIYFGKYFGDDAQEEPYTQRFWMDTAYVIGDSSPVAGEFFAAGKGFTYTLSGWDSECGIDIACYGGAAAASSVIGWKDLYKDLNEDDGNDRASQGSITGSVVYENPESTEEVPRENVSSEISDGTKVMVRMSPKTQIF